MKKTIFSIVSNNYLGQVLSLYDSVLEHCSNDIDFVCVISDIKNEKVRYDELGFDIIWPEDFLDNDLIEEMAFKYDVVEFNTALKPFAINFLTHGLGYERVYYFDPDTFLFDDIKSIEKYLDEKDIVLTPHIVDEIYRFEFKENEEAFLRNGVYNLGFFGMNKTTETDRFILWWMNKLRNQCYDDKSYFVDQKWLDFINIFSDNIFILKNKIYNVAKWNYFERTVTKKNGIFCIDNEKLCFFHFSGYNAADIQRHIEQEFTFAENKDVLIEIFTIYQRELEKNHFEEYRKMPYHYNFYDNGMVISKLNRRLFRNLLEDEIYYNNPFKCGRNTFYNLMEKNGLLSGVYKTSDLKAAISKEKSKEKLHRELDQVMRLVKKIIGVRRYELLLKYFSNYCTIDNQKFLINDKYLKK